MLAYAPQNADSTTPIFTWLHGGSFWAGGASMPEIDASALAAKGQVVFVPQYRLGLLGMMPPAGSPSADDPNLAIRDVVLALKSIQSNIGSKGNKNAVTLGGHSSGATIVRALWAAPSASGLFHRAMLQSDASGASLSKADKFKQVRDTVYGYDIFSGKNFDALKSLDVSVIVSAIRTRLSTLRYNGYLDSPDEFLHPVFGTSTIPHEPTGALVSSKGQLAVDPKNMPLLLSSTKDEGASFVGGFCQKPHAYETQPYGRDRAFFEPLVNRCANSVAQFPSSPYFNEFYDDHAPDSIRRAISKVATDGFYRCPARIVASSWAGKGGEVYVAEFTTAAPFRYSQNMGNNFCDDKVCHGVSSGMNEWS